MQIDAPAKVNLNLRILGKRSDGYHDLKSLMCPIALSDTLTIQKSEKPGIQLDCSDPTLPCNADNLVVRAAARFLEGTGLNQGLHIHLEKRIPHGAGLGGGSSDAASTFMALDRLLETHVGRDTLSQWSAELGSDIPFFIYESAAWIEGRGERVIPVGFVPRIPMVLIKPPFGISTPWAYRAFAESREVSDFSYETQPQSWGEMFNDLERPVFEKYFVLGELKKGLLKRPSVSGAMLSGSGSTVFAVLKSESAGGELCDWVAEEFGETFRTFITHTR